MESRDAVAVCLRAEASLERGDPEHARAALRSALVSHAENPIVHALLGRALAALGDTGEASVHFQRALTLDPHLLDVHLHYARLLVDAGDFAGSLEHARAAYKPVAAWRSPCRGGDRPVRVLQLVSAVTEGLTETEQFLGQGWFETTTIPVQYWHSGRELPAHDVVFNSIADATQCRHVLDVADWTLRHMTAPVLNPPQAVRMSSRLSNARRLSGIDGVVTPRVCRVQREALIAGQAGFAGEGLAFPLLLRTPGEHNGRNFVRVDGPSDVASAAASLPGEELLAIEFCDTRREGRFWKYRIMIVAGEIYPAHLAISENWNVHYFSAQMGNAERAHETAFLQDMESVLGTNAIAALKRIASVLDLQYAGVDFGLNDRGDVVVFEANAAMTLHVPPSSPETVERRKAVFRVFAAAREMVRDAAHRRT